MVAKKIYLFFSTFESIPNSPHYEKNYFFSPDLLRFICFCSGSEAAGSETINPKTIHPETTKGF
jgi:hypothetical protein